MKAYLVSVLLIAALSALASHFFADTEASRYARLAVSTVLLWAVLSPLVSLPEELPALPPLPAPDAGEEPPLYEQYAEEGYCTGVAAAVCEKFGLAADALSVRCEGFELQTMRAERVFILLKGSGIFADSYAIAAFVEAEGLGECEVEIEIGGS